MTLGTLSVEVDEEKPRLYVHWINVKTVEPEQTKEEIAGPFERFLMSVRMILPYPPTPTPI